MDQPAPVAPFDAVAREYDARFTETRLGRLLRGAVWQVAADLFRPEMRIVDIGCGTGEDAVWLAGRGVSVVATDASAAMLVTTRDKAARYGVSDRIETHHCRMEALAESDVLGPFDGAFSNFGALNCVESLPALANWLAREVRPGGALLAVVMGPWCPWEIIWELTHGRPRSAVRRLRPGGAEGRVGGRTLRVRYPSAGSLARTFAPAFEARFQAGLGLLLPTSEAGHLVEQWPGLFERLFRWERRVAGRRPLRNLGDHYILVLERTAG